MSVLARLIAQKSEDKKLFAVVAGRRLSGKTTLAGTLPGKTLLLQAAVLESGSNSAKQLSEQRGNELVVASFTSLPELVEVLKELKTDTEFTSVYIDGLSAMTDMKYSEPDMQRLIKKDNWGAFREIGQAVSDAILLAKELTYADKAKSPKSVFITVAIDNKTDANGNVIDVTLVAKGNKALSEITKLGEAVLTLVMVNTEEGSKRSILTKSAEQYPARIDTLLDNENPGLIEADLSLLTQYGVKL